MGPREQALNALFTIGQNLEWTDPQTGGIARFQFTSRRMKSFADVPNFPSLCQAEGDETIFQRSGLPPQQKITAHWVILHKAAANPGATPAQTNNEIVDAVMAALSPPSDGITGERFTLGGLAHRVWVEGKVFKDPGDIDQQGVVVVPISILLPD